MDYQTFNNQQPSFNGPYSTSLPGAPTHLAQPTHSPAQQQQQLYATDPSSRFQSSPSPFPNGQAGGFPMNMGGGGVAASGAMMQSQSQLHQARAALHHQQQQQQWQQQQQQQQHLQSPSPYTNSPYAQGLVSPAHQQFAQNRQTISPQSANSNVPSSFPTPQNMNPQPSPGLPSNNHQTMAAPATSQSQAPQAVKAETPVKAVPQSPISPAAQARDQERVSTLLDINILIIKEALELQTQGKAGQIVPPQDGKPEGEKPAPTKEYLELMRRLQANLAFLAQNAEKAHKPNQQVQPGPAIMVAPTSPDELVKLYTKLQSLFPGWKGQTMPMKASPGPQRLPSSTTQQPNSGGGLQSTPNSAGLPPNMNNVKAEQQSNSTPPFNPST